ncbi:hypothetical protein FRC19_011866 [Serendipita sp. 401]|nr:hypothetical protein FRC19_011866 [Serendipita sp. 401]
MSSTMLSPLFSQWYSLPLPQSRNKPVLDTLTTYVLASLVRRDLSTPSTFLSPSIGYDTPSLCVCRCFPPPLSSYSFPLSRDSIFLDLDPCYRSTSVSTPVYWVHPFLIHISLSLSSPSLCCPRRFLSSLGVVRREKT